VLHAARWKCSMQKIAQNSPSGHHCTTLSGYIFAHHCTTLSGYIFATKARIDNQKKNLLNSNVPPTCPHSMVNFCQLATEIRWRVWGTHANFNGFLHLGSIIALHSSSGRQSNIAALNRGCHLYVAGRPSRWVLAHISIFLYVCYVFSEVGTG